MANTPNKQEPKLKQCYITMGLKGKTILLPEEKAYKGSIVEHQNMNGWIVREVNDYNPQKQASK